ncbi:MAG: DUF433 domain-containing protein [Chloroflexi bacterium]|nr:DUF433 domain-containing protein [Chloroflexota bacterium]
MGKVYDSQVFYVTLELFASGATKGEVIKSYPQLTAEAEEEALKYAAQSIKNEILLDVQVSG